VVLAHARALLAEDSALAVVDADMHDPDVITGHPDVARLIDFDRPVAVMFVAVLHVSAGDERGGSSSTSPVAWSPAGRARRGRRLPLARLRAPDPRVDPRGRRPPGRRREPRGRPRGRDPAADVGFRSVRLVLASASPARLAILRGAGVEPLVEVSEVDEDALLAELGAEASAVDTVTALALAKARTVAARVAAVEPECVVVAADSMLFLDGELVGKPGSADVARGRWDQMAGSTAELFTGHALVRVGGGATGQEVAGHARTAVTFSRPTTDELEAYLASGEPLAVAGAFTLDGRGGWFVEGIEGDPSNVVGLSLPLVRRLLTEIGVGVDALWAASAGPRTAPAAG
jgi:septum formation protein